MRKAAIQDAISFSGFRVVKCDFDSVPELRNSDFDNVDIDFKFTTAFDTRDDKKYLIRFLIQITGQENRIKLLVESVAFFETNTSIDDEFRKGPFVTMNSPAIAFPFLRAFIQTFCVNSGIPPIILPSVDFTKSQKVAVNNK